MKLVVKTPWVEVKLPQLFGRIRDIGGGGEGVIGRTARDEIYILDIRRRSLKFPDEYFDTVTSFFSLMYMKDSRKVLKECYRVLRKGGKMLIWDVVIPRCIIYNINVIARSENEVIKANSKV